MIKPNFRHNINGKQLAIAVSQDYKTNEILMVAYMDEEAFNKTVETKKGHYYSTSRNKIWFKGEESGHIQHVKEILLDCDKDAILLKVEQIGGACHTGHYSCFYSTLSEDGNTLKETSKKVFNPNKVYE
ncbi:MAG: phosphoribosyl-AMP cyclohydrolase [Methanosphaera stadtmanae]|nr:phosphoribosyl-AMP cyclohydrolase [Methanosphaera stadtmanae]